MSLKYYNPITRVGLEGFQVIDMRRSQRGDPFVPWMMGPGKRHPPLLDNCLTLSLHRIVKQTGTSGQVDSKANSNANSALYSTLAAMGFFAR